MKKLYKILISAAVLASLAAATVFGGCTFSSNSTVSVTATASSDEDGAVITDASSSATTESSSQGTTSSETSSSTSVTYTSSGLTADYSTTDTVTQTYSIAQNMLSVATIYSDTSRTYSSNSYGPHTSTSFTYHDVYTGSGVIYSIQDDYVYFATCYHVVYNEEEGQVADSIYVYLYGCGADAEVVDYETVGTTAYYTEMSYSGAVECEYIGGSWAEDVAVIRAASADVLAVNDAVTAVTFCDSYSVGDTATAIGNYAGEGMMVSQGIVAVESEEIDLTLDTTNTFRVMRLDLNIYSGNSGGGLFNEDGYYIGMVNAMSTVYTNYAFAIPATVVCNSIDNIIYYANYKAMYTADMGLEVSAASSVYVYDSDTDAGTITEEVQVSSVTESSPAAEMGLEKGDIITAVTIDGTKYTVTRTFNIEDLELIIFPDSVVTVSYSRGGTAATSESYTFTSANISAH